MSFLLTDTTVRQATSFPAGDTGTVRRSGMHRVRTRRAL